MRLSILLVFFSICLTIGSYAQDTTIAASDTLVTPGKLYSEKTLEDAELIETESPYDPRIAGLYSAALPGLGQAYNRKFWKVPLVYAGFFFIGRSVKIYNDDYQFFRKELLESLAVDEGFPSPSGFTEEQIRNRVNRSRRERDYYIIIGCVWYLLNIADAHIDAHLSEFKVNEKLKLTVDPSLSSTSIGTRGGLNGGISLTLHFQ